MTEEANKDKMEIGMEIRLSVCLRALSRYRIRRFGLPIPHE